jgi:anti-sigma factor RsiW
MPTDDEIIDCLHALIDTNVPDRDRGAMHSWLRRRTIALAAFAELGVDFDEKGKPTPRN